MDMTTQTALTIAAALLATLAAGGLLADHVLPHVKPLIKVLKRLPLWDDLGPAEDVTETTTATEDNGRAA